MRRHDEAEALISLPFVNANERMPEGKREKCAKKNFSFSSSDSLALCLDCGQTRKKKKTRHSSSFPSPPFLASSTFSFIFHFHTKAFPPSLSRFSLSIHDRNLPKLTKKGNESEEEVLGLWHSPAHALVQLFASLLAASSPREKPVVLLSSSFLRSTACEHAEAHAEAHARGRLALEASSARAQAVGAGAAAAPEGLARAAESSPPRGPLPAAAQAATVRPALRLITLEEEEGGEEGEEDEEGLASLLSSISSIAYFFATDPRSWKKEMGSSSSISFAEEASGNSIGEETERTMRAEARSLEARSPR